MKSTLETLAEISTGCWAPALKNVLLIQVGLKIELKVTPKGDRQRVDLIASMPIESKAFHGSVALMFPEKTFLQLSNKMLGEDRTSISEENIDAAGELLNIIFASARTTVNGLGHDFQPAIPTLVKGIDSQLFHSSAESVLPITCLCELGVFYWESSLRPRKP